MFDHLTESKQKTVFKQIIVYKQKNYTYAKLNYLNLRENIYLFAKKRIKGF